MRKMHIAHRAAGLAVSLSLSLSSLAWAQQAPGTNAPTPSPAEPNGTTSSVELREPVIDTTIEQSSYPNTALLTTGFVVLGASLAWAFRRQTAGGPV